MQKSEDEKNFELIKLLCIMLILNELQAEPITKEFQKLSIYNVLD